MIPTAGVYGYITLVRLSRTEQIIMNTIPRKWFFKIRVPNINFSTTEKQNGVKLQILVTNPALISAFSQKYKVITTIFYTQKYIHEYTKSLNKFKLLNSPLTMMFCGHQQL